MKQFEDSQPSFYRQSSPRFPSSSTWNIKNETELNICLKRKKKKIIYVDVDIGPVKHKQKIAGFLLPKKPDM